MNLHLMFSLQISLTFFQRVLNEVPVLVFAVRTWARYIRFRCSKPFRLNSDQIHCSQFCGFYQCPVLNQRLEIDWGAVTWIYLARATMPAGSNGFLRLLSPNHRSSCFQQYLQKFNSRTAKPSRPPRRSLVIHLFTTISVRKRGCFEHLRGTGRDSDRAFTLTSITFPAFESSRWLLDRRPPCSPGRMYFRISINTIRKANHHGCTSRLTINMPNKPRLLQLLLPNNNIITESLPTTTPLVLPLVRLIIRTWVWWIMSQRRIGALWPLSRTCWMRTQGRRRCWSWAKNGSRFLNLL